MTRIALCYISYIGSPVRVVIPKQVIAQSGPSCSRCIDVAALPQYRAVGVLGDYHGNELAR
jgi:hypothetical protein